VIAIPLVFSIGGAWLGKALIGAQFGIAAFGSTLGGLAGAYLGSSLFPTDVGPASIPKIGGSYPTQTVMVGSCIPVVLGRGRSAGNIIYVGEAHPHTRKIKASGGKGGGSQTVGEETTYTRSFLIGLCEGPADIVKVWKGKEEIALSDCTIFDGEDNTTIATVTGLEFAQYRHLCCVWFDEYNIGASETIPMFTFEVNTIPTDKDLVAVGTGNNQNIGYYFDETGTLRNSIASPDSGAYACLWHPNQNVYIIEKNSLSKSNKYGFGVEAFGEDQLKGYARIDFSAVPLEMLEIAGGTEGYATRIVYVNLLEHDTNQTIYSFIGGSPGYNKFQIQFRRFGTVLTYYWYNKTQVGGGDMVQFEFSGTWATQTCYVDGYPIEITVE